MSLADTSLLRAEVSINSTKLMYMDDEQLRRYISNDLRQQLAAHLLHVGELAERQTSDGLVVTHEVVVFTRKEFQRIVREEARRMHERAFAAYVPPYKCD